MGVDTDGEEVRPSSPYASRLEACEENKSACEAHQQPDNDCDRVILDRKEANEHDEPDALHIPSSSKMTKQMKRTNVLDCELSSVSTRLKRGAVVNDEESTLETANTDESVDFKGVPVEECTSPLNPAEITGLLQHNTLHERDATYDALQKELASSNGSKPDFTSKPDIELIDDEGYAPLYKAALQGHLERVDDLVSKGENPDQQCKSGLSPLHAASREGHAHIVDFLILQGANVGENDAPIQWEGSTPSSCSPGRIEFNEAETNHEYEALRNATQEEISLRCEYFKLIMKNNSSNVEQIKGNSTSDTPLYTAAHEGNLQRVKGLIKSGVKPNGVNKNSLTPLHAAAQEGHEDIVAFLIRNGADVNAECKLNRANIHSRLVKGYSAILPDDKSFEMDDVTGLTPLHIAIQFGHLGIVKSLLKEGAKDSNIMEINSLSIAVLCGYKNIVRYLITNGSDANEGSVKGLTPLHLAVANGYIDIVKYLIQQGCDINKADCTGWTPYHMAIRNGKLDVLKYLTSKSVKKTIYEGMSPLYIAAQYGHLNIVKMLISRRNSVNTETKSGWSPLHAASVKGHLDIVKYLIQQGFDVNKQDCHGLTPVHLAVVDGYLDVVKYIMRKGATTTKFDGKTLLVIAAQSGHKDIVQFLLSKGADANEATKTGMIPLHCAAANGHIDTMRYLIQHRSNINKADNTGCTSFHMGITKGHLEVVKYLLKKGAQSTNFDGMNPIYLAASSGHLDIVKFFKSKGSNLQEASEKRRIPLHGAAANGHLDVVQYLIEQESDLNREDDAGLTALHMGIKSGHLEIVKYLLEKNANKTKHKGMTPIFLAAQSGHKQIVEFFCSKGANVNEADESGRIALHGAAANGHLNVVQYLIEQDSDLNREDDTGLTAFHSGIKSGKLEVVKYMFKHVGRDTNYDRITPIFLAARLGHTDIIKFFLSNGADVNAENKTGLTPLHGAVEGGHLDTVQYLIEQGSDMSKGDDTGWTPFHSGIKSGSPKIVECLLKTGLQEAKYAGMTSLYMAAIRGHLELVKHLFSKGYDVNAENESLRIPLHGAAANGHIEIIKYLIQQGSKVNKSDDSGRTPLHIAVESGELAVIKYLLEKKGHVCDGMSPIFLAALSGHKDVVHFFISKGADVNAEDDIFVTPLHCAAATGRLDLVQYLIDQGSNVNKADCRGWTPFHSAAQNGHLKVVECLLKNGAERTKYAGMTPLFIVAHLGNLDVVEYLTSTGPGVNEQNETGMIPLHGAVAGGHLDVVKYLIKQGSDLNKGDETGFTPFHMGIKSGHLEVVQYLLQEKARETKYDGMTPIYLAAQLGHTDIIEFFVSQGTDVNAKNERGITPLHGAAAGGHLDVVKYLTEQRSDFDDIDYQTAFKMAAKNGHTDVGLFFTKFHQASLNRINPLYVATQYCNIDLVKSLVSEGYDINKAIICGKCPLHAASFRGRIDIVKYLVHHNAEVNLQDSDGWTPVHAAAQEGHLDVVDYLASNGADITTRDVDGMTPLQAAERAGHSSVMECLMKLGCNRSNEDQDKREHGVHVGPIKATPGTLQKDDDSWSSEGSSNSKCPGQRFDNELFQLEATLPLHSENHFDDAQCLNKEKCVTGCEGGEGKLSGRGNSQICSAQQSCATLAHQEPPLSLEYKHQQVDEQYPSEGRCKTPEMDEENWSQEGETNYKCPLLGINAHNSSEMYERGEKNDGSASDNNDVSQLEVTLSLHSENHFDDAQCLNKEKCVTGCEGGEGKLSGRGNSQICPAQQSCATLAHQEPPLSSGNEYQLGDAQCPSEGGCNTPEMDEENWSQEGETNHICPSLGMNAHNSSEMYKRAEKNDGSANAFSKYKFQISNNNDINAQLKYRNKSVQDSSVDRIGAVKDPTSEEQICLVDQINLENSRYSSRNGRQEHSGFDQGNEEDDPIGVAVSRSRTISKEVSSSIQSGKGVPINQTSNRSKSIIRENIRAAAHQPSQEVNAFSIDRSSSNTRREIKKKRRAVNNPCSSFPVLGQIFFHMTIALWIFLVRCPVIVAGSTIAERLILQAGNLGAISFQLPWRHDSKPYFTLRFESKQRPFCINGHYDIEGFKNPAQSPRFKTTLSKEGTSLCLNLTIDTVDTLDQDVYVFNVVVHRIQGILLKTVRKEVMVQTPPGPAKCFITLSESSVCPYEVHCQATTGSVPTALTCYQNSQKIGIKGDVESDSLSTRAVFMLPDNLHFSCCSHDVNSDVSESSCNDFDWPPRNKDPVTTHVSTANVPSSPNTRTTLHAITTSSTKLTESPSPFQVESGGTCRQCAPTSAWPSLNLFGFLVYFALV